MIDADHFKQVNDLHGHEMADEVTVRLVQACNAGLRQTDTLGRIGGEEFCVFLTDFDLDSATEVAERLREEIGSVEIGTGRARICIAASI
jgi:diguanylate cyclase (GGDEF)-like protein